MDCLTSLEVLRIGSDFEVPVEGLYALLTTSRLRHLTIPPVKWGQGNSNSLVWSGVDTLESLTFCPIETAENANLFLPVLQHLPRLKRVGIMGTLDLFIEHAELVSCWLAFLAPYECLDGKLDMLARVDDPRDPTLDDYSIAMEGLALMDKQELADRLR